MRTGVVVSVLVLVTIGLAFLIRFTSFKGQDRKAAELSNSKSAAPAGKESGQLEVTDRWDVPDILKEISGIAFAGPDRFVCVQDEAGSVFIYDAGKRRIEKEIPFGKDGDYEDLAVVGNSVFVLKSNGKLYEIEDYLGKAPRVKEYPSTLKGYDFEGLWFDQKSNRLLLAVKESDADDDDKGAAPGEALVYGFDLKTRQMLKDPVFRIRLDDPVLPKVKDGQGRFKPSAIAIHPVTAEIYLLEGVKSRLLVLGPDGKPDRLYSFAGKDLKQPEGLAFSPDGKLYVCSEGSKKHPGVIAAVTGF